MKILRKNKKEWKYNYLKNNCEEYVYDTLRFQKDSLFKCLLKKISLE